MRKLRNSSLALYARAAGVLYLVTIIAGIFSEANVLSALIVADNAAATASNILAHEVLYRFGIAASLIMLACYLAVTLLFFEIFQHVNRRCALLATFFSLTGIAVLAVNTTLLLAPLSLLGGARYLSAFGPDRLQASTYISLTLQDQGYDVALVFFGFYCLLIGYLIFKSTFLPKGLGVLMGWAGTCYLVNSFAMIISPPFKTFISTYILLPCLIGETSLSLWLIVLGLNVPKWEQQALERTD